MNEDASENLIFVDPAALCQLEIPVSDLSCSLDFYESVLGWKAVPAEIFDYAVMTISEDSRYGIALKRVPSFQSHGEHVLVYFRTDLLEEVLVKAGEKGGRIVNKLRVIAGFGVAAVFADPDGNRIGLFHRQATLD